MNQTDTFANPVPTKRKAPPKKHSSELNVTGYTRKPSDDCLSAKKRQHHEVLDQDFLSEASTTNRSSKVPSSNHFTRSQLPESEFDAESILSPSEGTPLKRKPSEAAFSES
jgi:hypothetical protein